MAMNFNGSNQWALFVTLPPHPMPLTMAFWFRPTSTIASTHIPLGLFDFFNAGGTWFGHYFLINATSAHIDSVYNNSFGTGSSYSQTFTGGVWYHLTGVFTSTSSRQVFVNGSAGGLDTSSVTDPTGESNGLTIGVGNHRQTLEYYFPGDIAEIGYWSAALSSDEIVSLAKGFRPTLIRPNALRHYLPLDGINLDRRTGDNLSLTNSPTQANSHPPMIQRRRITPVYQQPISGTIIPRVMHHLKQQGIA